MGKTIGEGAFSKVKIATHIDSGEKVAIKIIDKKVMAEMVARAKKHSAEREKRRLILERRKARSDAIRLERLSNADEDNFADAPVHSLTDIPVDFSKIIDDLVLVNDEIEKVELPIQNISADFMPLLENEVKLALRLGSHPHIIQTFQIIDSHGECYVVMELAKGGDLMEYINNKGRMDEQVARRLFGQVLSGLAHIHSCGVVHRDIKLENILLNDDNCLISDFGLGRSFELNDHQDMNTFCGTPAYTSAELVAGLPYDGIKSDIWALGVVLYLMTTGNRPFSGSSITILHYKILNLKYDTPAYLSSELIDLLSKIFVSDPCKRLSLDSIRQHPWLNLDSIFEFIPAYPSIDSGEGQVINSIHNDNEFTVYTLKARFKATPVTQEVKARARGLSVNGNGRNFNTPEQKRLETQNNRKLSLNTTKIRRLSLHEPISPNRSSIDHSILNFFRKKSEESPETSTSLTSSNEIPMPRRVEKVEMKSRTRQPSIAHSILEQNENEGAKLDSNLPIILASANFDSKQDESPLSPNYTGEKHFQFPTSGSNSSTLASKDRELRPVNSRRRASTLGGVVARPSLDMQSKALKDAQHMALNEANEVTKEEITAYHETLRPPRIMTRTARFSFTKGTSSAILSPSAIFKDLFDCLLNLQENGRDEYVLTFKRNLDYYLFEVEINYKSGTEEVMKFDCEVCKLWLLKVHGIRLKRYSGEFLAFKRICEQISSLNLK